MQEKKKSPDSEGAPAKRHVDGEIALDANSANQGERSGIVSDKIETGGENASIRSEPINKESQSAVEIVRSNKV